MADNAASSLNPDVVYVSDLNRVGTRLPDALLDDHTISPLAKMAYWHIKRHYGRTGVRDVASAVQADEREAWRLIAELTELGWLDAPAATEHPSVVFTVHEVPAVER